MRTPRVDKNGLKKGAWSAEEDQKLIDYISRYRIWNWSLMPKYAGLSRNGKSCRLRWVNYLDPNIRRGNITKEEEKIIIDMYAKIGSRWSKIAAKLPARSDNEIKNYWHTHLKKLFNEKPNQRMKSLAIEIPKLEPIQENSCGCNDNIIPSASASEASNSQDSNNPTMTPCVDGCGDFQEIDKEAASTASEASKSQDSNNPTMTPCVDGCGDFQEIDQEGFDSSESETIGYLINSFWAQPFFGGNGDIEYEQKEKVDVQEWYQEPLSPYEIYSSECWLNEFGLMDAAEPPKCLL